MGKNLICLSILVPVLGMVWTSAAQADLIGWWRFDEGSGGTASDASGNGNHGTLQGDPQWVAGRIGGALEFNGTDSMINIPYSSDMTPSQGTTMAAWVFPTDTTRSCIVGQFEGYGVALMTGLQLKSVVWGADWVLSDVTIPQREWSHVAMTWDVAGSERMIFLNGETVGQRGDAAVPNVQNNLGIGLWVGWPASWGDDSFMGIIDDVQVHDTILTEDEIKVIMKGQGNPYAFGPDPKDDALHEATWVTLSWKAGDFAVSHDVYLGDNFDDVDSGTGDTFRGNQTGTFVVAGFPGYPYPDGLTPGTTYYWRIDEVNDADPNSPWKGLVWSFSVPPKTAYDPTPIDGAEAVGPDDVTLSWTPGFGAKLHTVYFGETFDDVNDAVGGAPMGLTTYEPGPLESAKVYHWRVDEFDAITTYKGDVWSFTTPGAVGGPQPAYNATDVAMNAPLSWTEADSAVTNHLYFGTDKEAVRNADTSAPEYKGSIFRPDEVYDYNPGLLEANTAYYWRVDAVDAQGNVSKGPVWIFMTGAFLLVDDFEGYTDDDWANRAIWQTWIDGFGVPDNGAQVGYLLPPYAEQTIVHGGSQSMPLLYINEAGVTNSEASMTQIYLSDWTQAGVTELSLWFRGASGNAAEPLYVSVSNSAGAPAIVANDDPGAATVRTWTQWIIPLQAFADQGINLSNVDKIAIGLGSKSGMTGVSGSGTIYIDDIRLYR
jgi:hypothetical protein